ncbi:MAG: hypothetical protein R3C28_26160 [Pirellulaceae bacterium]
MSVFGAADIYITPYLQEQQQIVSGTLAYALGAGKSDYFDTLFLCSRVFISRSRLCWYRFKTAGAPKSAGCLQGTSFRRMPPDNLAATRTNTCVLQFGRQRFVPKELFGNSAKRLWKKEPVFHAIQSGLFLLHFTRTKA